MIGAFVGAVSGVFLRTWANQLGKQRRFARKSDSIPSTTCHYLTDVLSFSIGPWNHLFLGVVGGYIGHNYTRWEKELLENLNAKRKEKGLAEITRQDMTIFNTK